MNSAATKKVLLLAFVGLVAAANAAVLPPPSNQLDDNEIKESEEPQRPNIRLFPAESDLIFRSGDTFSLVCEADFPLDWKLPSILETRDYGVTIKNELEDRILIVDEQLREVEDDSSSIPYPYRSTLTVNEASYIDTGYFICHHRESEEGDEEVKTYVYVADDDNLIVQHRQVMMFSQRLSRFSKVVPCKPSHPDIEMSIMIGKDEKADWVYDPHVGFYVDNEFLDGPRGITKPIYRCVARHPKGFESDTPVYIWQSFKPLLSMESEIGIQVPARRILIGQHFHLNCSITYYQKQNLTVELHWMVPSITGITGKRVRSEKVVLNAPPRGGKKRTTVRLTLRVQNATLEDTGYYMCASLQSSYLTNSMDWAEVFVNIHHLDEESYLRVTTPYNDGPREVEAGKSATFVVYIDARPDPIVNWYRDGQLEPINTTSKYVVHRSWGKTYLKIRDASIEDNGVYRLVAISGKERRSVNFSLVVEDQVPSTSIMSWRYSFDYFSPLFWIHSQPPIVGFSYVQCRPPLPCQTISRRAGDNDETVWEVDTPRHKNSDNRIVLEPLTIYVNSSYISSSSNVAESNSIDSAVANNTTELATPSNEAERFFYLGWVVNMFYNSTGNGSWWWTQTDGTSVQLDLSNPPPGFNVSQRQCLERRGYCYRIKGINTNSDQLGHAVLPGEVFTWTFASAVDQKHVSVPIQIKDAQEPVIINSSGSEVVIVAGQTATLYCQADGTPTPALQWLKDGQPVPEEWIDTFSDGVSSLKIEEASSLDHDGVYVCRYENIAGNAEGTIQLYVIDASA